MPHLSPRILMLISVLYLSACGQSALVQPDLIAGRFQAGEKITAATTSLTVIDYYSTKAADLQTIPSNLLVIDASSQEQWNFFLGFSQFLKGDLIERVNKNQKNGQVKDFTPIPGSVEVWTCPVSSGCLKPSDFTSVSNFSISYRPDGGYVPKPDTPVSDFPPPAIALTFPKVTAPETILPAASMIAVYVIAGKVANTDGTLMKQVSDADGNKITTPGGNPIAGAVFFRTK